MPSLRKRVSSYFRQLSFHNEPREKRNNFIENTFINKYLQGEVKLKEGPPIIYGKNPTDLPNYEVGFYTTGSNTIVGCYTGPNGGLTTVKRSEKHLSVLDQDIDFIDTADESVADPPPIAPAKKSPARHAERPLDNTTMVIKVAGQEYHVTNRKARRKKSQSLGSLSDFKIEVDKTKRIANSASSDNNNGDAAKCDRLCDSNRNEEPVVVVEVKRRVRIEASGGEKGGFTPLEKSQSEGNPFGHKKRGKITRLAQRPTVDATSDSGGGTISNPAANLPQEWSRGTEHCFGVSDSLYDKNLITKMKNGDPIADCFGIIARTDSAILAVADGVNWGEKASIAAKSAIHGCIHYLNKTIFLDTKPFDNLIRVEEGAIKSETPIHESRISNTREVFVCLLRAFNCAHDLILENKGMLTTLTVAVVLPLKRGGEKEAEQNEGDGFVCCVCNVGDTLAYVYSQKHGVRELTKGSHDINCNRDMRDALGALGPVDGINPELSNLTLSITTIQKGDIVLIASDGLTDNFDPNVCKFTVSPDVAKTRKPSTTQPPKPASTKPVPAANKQVPTKPPRRSQASKSTTVKAAPVRKTTPPLATTSKPEQDSNNPLVAAFVRDNPLNKSAGSSQRGGVVAGRPMKSASAKDMPRTLDHKPPERNYSFLRSKTSLDLRSAKSIARNPDGMPFVTPLQRYELTLLLMEDILKRGISGKENQCVTAKKLCENLVSFTISITNAKRRTLEDSDLYFNNQNGVLVEVSQQEKKMRRKRGLEKVQNLPGKLDHVTAVAYNVANTILPP